MASRRFKLIVVVCFLASSLGCELTATAYVEQRWVSDPHFKSPDGSAKAEIKITRLVGRDKPKR